jgi:rubrerythrin
VPVLIRAICEDLARERRLIDGYLRAMAEERDPATRRLVEQLVALKQAHARELQSIGARVSEQRLDSLLDEALEETFPASDPPSLAIDVLRDPRSASRQRRRSAFRRP